MMTAEQQLAAAMDSMQQQQGQEYVPNVSPADMQSIRYGTAIANAGNTAFAVGTTGLALSTMFTSRFNRLIGRVDPFTALFGQNVGRATMMARLPMALGAAGIQFAAGAAIKHASEQMIQGQSELIASRQLLREIPNIGFSPNSVLGGTTIRNTPMDDAAFRGTINQFASGFGVNASTMRNTISSLGNMGIIGGSSPQEISKSLRKRMQELREIARIMESDIAEATSMYQDLQQMGVRGPSARMSTIRSINSISSLTGRSRSEVAQYLAMGSEAARASGLNASTGISIAQRSLATSAVLEAGGALNRRYLHSVGGYEGFTQRMIELNMGISGSIGGMEMMANIFDPSGGFRQGSSRRRRSAYGFMRQVDPYELADMRDQFASAQGSFVLSRVNEIRARASSERAANRRQFQFLSSLGIQDADEQLAYLQSLRSESAGRYAAASQEGADVMIGAIGGRSANPLSPNSLTSAEAPKLFEGIRRQFDDFNNALRRLGASITMAVDDILRSEDRVRNPGNLSRGRYSMGDMSMLNRSIRRGDISGSLISPVAGLRDQMNTALGRGIFESGILAETSNIMGPGGSFISRPIQSAVGVSRMASNLYMNAIRATGGFLDEVNPSLSAFLFGNTHRSTSSNYLVRGTPGAGGAQGVSGGVSADDLMAAVASSMGASYDRNLGRVVNVSAEDTRRFAAENAEALNISTRRTRYNLRSRNDLGLQSTDTMGMLTRMGRGALTGSRSAGQGSMAAGAYVGTTAAGLGHMAGRARAGGMVGGLIMATQAVGMEIMNGLTDIANEMSNDEIMATEGITEYHSRKIRGSAAYREEILNDYARGLGYGSYSEMGTDQQMLLRGAIMEEAPDLGRALFNQNLRDVSTNDVASALYRTQTRNVLASAFGISSDEQVARQRQIRGHITSNNRLGVAANNIRSLMANRDIPTEQITESLAAAGIDDRELAQMLFENRDLTEYRRGYWQGQGAFFLDEQRRYLTDNMDYDNERGPADNYRANIYQRGFTTLSRSLAERMDLGAIDVSVQDIANAGAIPYGYEIADYTDPFRAFGAIQGTARILASNATSRYGMSLEDLDEDPFTAIGYLQAMRGFMGTNGDREAGARSAISRATEAFNARGATVMQQRSAATAAVAGIFVRASVNGPTASASELINQVRADQSMSASMRAQVIAQISAAAGDRDTIDVTRYANMYNDTETRFRGRSPEDVDTGINMATSTALMGMITQNAGTRDRMMRDNIILEQQGRNASTRDYLSGLGVTFGEGDINRDNIFENTGAFGEGGSATAALDARFEQLMSEFSMDGLTPARRAEIEAELRRIEEIRLLSRVNTTTGDKAAEAAMGLVNNMLTPTGSGTFEVDSQDQILLANLFGDPNAAAISTIATTDRASDIERLFNNNEEDVAALLRNMNMGGILNSHGGDVTRALNEVMSGSQSEEFRRNLIEQFMQSVEVNPSEEAARAERMNREKKMQEDIAKLASAVDGDSQFIRVDLATTSGGR